ncbi:M15 family metallopeptidase [Brevibacillus dissolubilis]|uniref:M15 family metallopeptidase n=1 Tax=Brevibacillus dissolubilis TaxID=1844116 RepID=UPI00111798D9|nr:M15 family metallopeptidase [Brevibacillus dissolubilis]
MPYDIFREFNKPIPPEADRWGRAGSDLPPVPHAHAHDQTPDDFTDCGEPLVSLSGLSPKIQIAPIYHQQGLPGATADCYARSTVALRLVQAAELLPDGYSLVILDAWRPCEVQQALYDSFRQTLINQGWPDDETLTEELRKYVAKPSTDIDKPSRHLTGGAIDLTIAGPDGWLDMGGPFDDFTARAATRYYEEITRKETMTEERACVGITSAETKIAETIDPLPEHKTVAVSGLTSLRLDANEKNDGKLQYQAHRRYLYHLMISAGFTNYAKEWWHYDYGNLPWAKQTGEIPLYKGVLSPEAI